MSETTLNTSSIVADAETKPEIPLEDAAVYRFGHLIRLTKRLLLKLFSDGLLTGTTHTCLGQELCQMSVVRALRDPDDHVLSNHRNHGHFLTYSGSFLGLIAEIMGRAGGVCGGIGGSQHLAFRHFHSNGAVADDNSRHALPASQPPGERLPDADRRHIRLAITVIAAGLARLVTPTLQSL
jgi:TPP-dependent pyruvate/acetoin dehydrogenase alpha subunit